MAVQYVVKHEHPQPAGIEVRHDSNEGSATMGTTYTFWIVRESATGPRASGGVEAITTADGWRLDMNPRYDEATDTLTFAHTLSMPHGTEGSAALDTLVSFLTDL